MKLLAINLFIFSMILTTQANCYKHDKVLEKHIRKKYKLSRTDSTKVMNSTLCEIHKIKNPTIPSTGASVSAEAVIRVIDEEGKISSEDTLINNSGLTITTLADLKFPDSRRGQQNIRVGSNEPGAAVYSITGQPNTFYSIVLPTSVQLIEAGSAGTHPTEILTVEEFEHNQGTTPVISSNGTTSMKVGAMVESISNINRKGIYTGTFLIEVAY
jgi:hypothetical protein